MPWPQVVFGVVLVVVTCGLAVGYTGVQVRALRRLARSPHLPLEEQRFERRRAWRRLLLCGLLLVLGGLLTVALVYLEDPVQRLVEEREAGREAGDLAPLTSEQRALYRSYGFFWIFFLLVLMAVVFLAAAEIWEVRRYGLRLQRRLQDDRRAMIERQIHRYHQERNGHGG